MGAAGLVGIVGAVGLWLASEAVGSWGSRQELPRDLDARECATGTGLREAVAVLGYGNPGERANAINRWRVRVGLRSRDPRAVSSLVVMCGGPVHSARPEGEILAAYARDELGYSGLLAVEGESTTTWENIVNATPLLEDADRIVIASDPLHAMRARYFLRLQRPDLARRLARGDDHRLGERFWLKPALAVVGLEGLRRARAITARSGRTDGSMGP